MVTYPPEPLHFDRTEQKTFLAKFHLFPLTFVRVTIHRFVFCQLQKLYPEPVEGPTSRHKKPRGKQNPGACWIIELSRCFLRSPGKIRDSNRQAS